VTDTDNTGGTDREHAERLDGLLAGTSLDTPAARRLRARTTTATAARTRLRTYYYLDEPAAAAMLDGTHPAWVEHGAAHAHPDHFAQADPELLELAAAAPMHDAATVAELLRRLLEADAEDLFRALANRAAAQLELNQTEATMLVADNLYRAGARDACRLLVTRMARTADPGDPDAVGFVLAMLSELGNRGEGAELARRATTHVDIRDPARVAHLLEALTSAGHTETAAGLLARRPADAAALEDPVAVAKLIHSLFNAGDPDAVAQLAVRAALGLTVTDLHHFADLIYTMDRAHVAPEVIEHVARRALRAGLIDLDLFEQRLSAGCTTAFTFPDGDPTRLRELLLDLILTGLRARRPARGPREVTHKANLSAWLVAALGLKPSPRRPEPDRMAADLLRYLGTALGNQPASPDAQCAAPRSNTRDRTAVSVHTAKLPGGATVVRGAGTNYVLIVPLHGGGVAVRDPKNPKAPTLAFTADEWAAFLEQTRAAPGAGTDLELAPGQWQMLLALLHPREPDQPPRPPHRTKRGRASGT